MNAELLSNVYFFEGLESSELVDVLRICKQESFRKDMFIFLEGDMSDKCYVIESGSVGISKFIPSLGEKDLAELRKGSYFGEMALIDGSPRSASAVAKEFTKCLVIEKEDLDRLMLDNKVLGNKILWTICRTLSKRLRETNDKLSELVDSPGGVPGQALQ